MTSNRVAIVLSAVVATGLIFGMILLGPLGCRSGPAERATATIKERADGFVCLDCNVILISIDTLRADRLGAYGYERPTSPGLDTLARESVVFRDVLAGAVDCPFSCLPPLRPLRVPAPGRADERTSTRRTTRTTISMRATG